MKSSKVKISYSIKLWGWIILMGINLYSTNIIGQVKKSKIENVVSKVIKHYSRYSFVLSKFKYSKISFDSTKISDNYYLLIFGYSNDKLLILNDSLISENFEKNFPNRIDSIKDHLILWNDGTGIKREIVSLLSKKSLIDSFYVKFDPKNITTDNIDKIEYPTIYIDERKKITYYIIRRRDNHIVRVLRTRQFENLKKVLRKYN